MVFVICVRSSVPITDSRPLLDGSVLLSGVAKVGVPLPVPRWLLTPCLATSGAAEILPSSDTPVSGSSDARAAAEAGRTAAAAAVCAVAQEP